MLKELFDSFRTSIQPHQVDAGDGSVKIVIDGNQKVETLSHATEKPPFIRQKVNVSTVDSMIKYLEKYKQLDTVVTREQGRISRFGAGAKIDYHGPEEADRCVHECVLNVDPTPEYLRVTERLGDDITQAEFAKYLETIADYIRATEDDPESVQGPEIQQLVKNLTISSNSKAELGVDEIGLNTIKYEAQNKTDTKVPSYFYAVVRPYKESNLVAIKIRISMKQMPESKGVLFSMYAPVLDQIIEDEHGYFADRLSEWCVDNDLLYLDC